MYMLLEYLATENMENIMMIIYITYVVRIKVHILFTGTS